MPVYEFACQTCGPFEERRSRGDAGAPAVCPTCGGQAARVYSAPYLALPGKKIGAGSPGPKLVQQEPEEPDRRPEPQVSGGLPWAIGG